MTVTSIEPVQHQGQAQSNRRQPSDLEAGDRFERLMSGPEPLLPAGPLPDAPAELDEELDTEETADDLQVTGEAAPVPLVDLKGHLPTLDAEAGEKTPPASAKKVEDVPQTVPEIVAADANATLADQDDARSADPLVPPDLAPPELSEPPLERVETETSAEIVFHQGRDVRVDARLPNVVNIPHLSAPQEVTRQIAEAVRSADDTRFEITLTPEELGKVRLVIVPGEKPSVAVYADNSATLDLLRRNADLLDRELRDAGLGGATLSFGDGNQQDSRHGPARISGHEIGLHQGKDNQQINRPAQTISLRQLDIRI